MTTFNTGNPIGSTDVYDRYDNSENLDNFSNGPLDAYADRFGVMRQSLQGIRNASQYVNLGPYAAGLNFTALNQVFSYDAGSGAEFYAPGPSITLPYTTTGAGAGEIANFRSVGDAVLRQDLNSANPSKGSALVKFTHTGAGASPRTVQTKLNESASVKDFGATGDGVTNDTAAFAAAVQSGVDSVFVPVGTYLLSNLTVPDGVTITGASVRDSILKKFASGRVIQSLGRHSKLLNLKIDGGGVGITGNSVEISLGDNVPAYIDQGHQLIENCWFANGNGYHVAYTAANKGYQSKVSRCIFDEPLGAGGLAAILWPDEPQNGGNRYVQTCYSSGPLVNLNGCDNGHITECIVGAGTKGGDQGILMPTGTVNSAKKAFIADNRFAVADLPMVFRGSSHVVTGNSFAATVTLANVFEGSLFADNLTTQPIVDSLGDTSGTRVYHSQAVTPNFRSAGGGALIGNAVVSGLIEWKGLSKYYSGKFKFGSTTNFGAGQFITDLVGAVSGAFGFSGDWQCLDVNTSVQWDGSIFCSPGGSNSMAFADRGNTVNATYPFTWASGDELHWEAKVR